MSKRSKGEYLALFRLLSESRAAYWTGLAGGSLGNALVSVIMAFTLMEMIGAVMRGDLPSLYRALYGLGLVMLAVAVLSPLFSYWRQTAVKRNMAALRREGYAKLVRLPMSRIDSASKGDVSSRLNNDINQIEQTFTDQAGMVLYTAFLGIGSAAAMFLLSWRFAIVLIVLSVVSYAVNRLLSGRIRKDGDALQRQLGAVSQSFSELLSGALVLRLFPAAGRFQRKFADDSRAAASLSVSLATKTGWLEAVNYLVNFLSFGGIIAMGALLVLYGNLSIETAVALVQLQTNVNFAFNQWSRFVAGLQVSLASAARVRELLESPVEKNSRIRDAIRSAKRRRICRTPLLVRRDAPGAQGSGYRHPRGKHGRVRRTERQRQEHHREAASRTVPGLRGEHQDLRPGAQGMAAGQPARSHRVRAAASVYI